MPVEVTRRVGEYIVGQTWSAHRECGRNRMRLVVRPARGGLGVASLLRIWRAALSELSELPWGALHGIVRGRQKMQPVALDPPGGASISCLSVVSRGFLLDLGGFQVKLTVVSLRNSILNATTLR